jgi:hypothetical protein
VLFPGREKRALRLNEEHPFRCRNANRSGVPVETLAVFRPRQSLSGWRESLSGVGLRKRLRELPEKGVNKDKDCPGDYYASQIQNFGRKLGYSTEEMAMPDNALDVVKAFAAHYGMTVEEFGNVVNEWIIEEYGVTIQELHAEMIELSRRGEVLVLKKSKS